MKPRKIDKSINKKVALHSIQIFSLKSYNKSQQVQVTLTFAATVSTNLIPALVTWPVTGSFSGVIVTFAGIFSVVRTVAVTLAVTIIR